VGTTYKRWAELVRKNISSFSLAEQAKIMGENAVKIYNL
jgi:predicted TIM-barrel fold metal-dependent hydrolase